MTVQGQRVVAFAPSLGKAEAGWVDQEFGETTVLATRLYEGLQAVADHWRQALEAQHVGLLQCRC